MESTLSNQHNRASFRSSAQETQLLGYSRAMNKLRYQIQRAAPTEIGIFLIGESGAGKELVAQEIHAQSHRSQNLFSPINCGAISPQLIESELFGHEKGSFTGADRLHKGYFERANGGTLFLDEILEMPMSLQAKLLRVLETGKFTRVGGSLEIYSDVRIIAASNQDPAQAVNEGRLRLDLYHRLNTFPIRLSALRDRDEDIELLATHFLNECNQVHQTEKILSKKMMSNLRQYTWPGNIRELRNFIERAYILCDTELDMPLPTETPRAWVREQAHLTIRLGATLDEVDRQFVLATLSFCGGIKKHAAAILGISLKTLYNRLEEYRRHEKRSSSIESAMQDQHPMSFLNGETYVQKVYVDVGARTGT